MSIFGMQNCRQSRSQVSVLSVKSDLQPVEEVYTPPMDVMTVTVKSLQISDEISKLYAIKVTFFDQLLISGTILPSPYKQPVQNRYVIMGEMNYDPSDYEKMCLMADCPLVVYIQPMTKIERNVMSSQLFSSSTSDRSSISVTPVTDVSCCNIDILPIFIDKEKMSIEKRMEPMLPLPLLQRSSWDNLPLLTLEVTVDRNKQNSQHHELLKKANYMKITLIAAYNMPISYEEGFSYTAASKTPLFNETKAGLVIYNQGHKIASRFNCMSFYPKWEALRVDEYIFSNGDEKLVCDPQTIQNNDNLDLPFYMSKLQRDNCIVWGSFHRTLMLGHSESWIIEHLRKLSWPFEVHINGEEGGLSFMAFLNLFYLLYPGEHKVRIAVPLEWVNADSMNEKCACELLLTPNPYVQQHSSVSTPKGKTTDSVVTSTDTDMAQAIRPTGADENCSFIIVEVLLARPLKKAVIPTIIRSSEIHSLLREMELGPNKRECTGRGQLDRNWQATVRAAENALKKVPHYGMTEFCMFNRQLSETRTRVELMTSCWMDAAIYVNNNFVIQEYLKSENVYEEMLMMAHACLVRMACITLVGSSSKLDVSPTLRAARHARQMNDTTHALELYLQHVVMNPRDANGWRELATCMLDVDRDWASVCINKSVVLEPRHHLSLLSKACMLFEEDPDAAEPFFQAILSLYPFWLSGWVAASSYYMTQKQFHMADKIIEHVRKSQEEGLIEDDDVRSWGHELGDWWDSTPLLPGMCVYYTTADLLLRIRAITLAEVCLSQAVLENGETAASFHLVALCWRLRGEFDDALCHLQLGIDKFGDINYLRGLEAECNHNKGNTFSAMASYVKAGSCLGAYSILLSLSSWEALRARSMLMDLIRRLPSAYAWVALAEDWIQRAGEGGKVDTKDNEDQMSMKSYAAACAVQALKLDRQAGRAWAILARLMAPSARRKHCADMARACGYVFPEERRETGRESQQSLCHRLGKALRECRCNMCKNLKF